MKMVSSEYLKILILNKTLSKLDADSALVDILKYEYNESEEHFYIYLSLSLPILFT